MSHMEDSVLEQPDEQSTTPSSTQKKIYGVAAEFKNEHELLEAIEAVRSNGYHKLDAFTPFPVHGLDDALGLKRSRLGWLVLGIGALGAFLALLMQWWTGTIGYPVVVGGKPLFAIEPSIPITFELTVLLAAFGAVFGMLAFNGLPQFYHPVFNHTRFHRVSDDRFLLAIEADNPTFDPDEAIHILKSAGGKYVEVVEA